MFVTAKSFQPSLIFSAQAKSLFPRIVPEMWFAKVSLSLCEKISLSLSCSFLPSLIFPGKAKSLLNYRQSELGSTDVGKNRLIS